MKYKQKESKRVEIRYAKTIVVFHSWAMLAFKSASKISFWNLFLCRKNKSLNSGGVIRLGILQLPLKFTNLWDFEDNMMFMFLNGS